MNKQKLKHRLYFAYGSNLRHVQMRKRCPHSTFVTKGFIKDWELAFGGLSVRWGGGTATIQPRLGHKLWGAVYELDNHCIKKLDRFETVPLHFYYHRLFDCEAGIGSVLKVYTYLKDKNKMKARQPSAKYLRQIIKGAEESGLPQDYIKSLQRVPIYRHTIIKT